MSWLGRLLAKIFGFYFGHWMGGRVGRFVYLVFGALAAGLFLAFSAAVGLSGGIANQLWLYLPVAVVLLAGLLNILTKRWRDIGLPGWLATLLFLVSCAVLGILTPGYVTAAFLVVIALMLLVMPGRRGDGATTRQPQT